MQIKRNESKEISRINALNIYFYGKNAIISLLDITLIKDYRSKVISLVSSRSQVRYHTY